MILRRNLIAEIFARIGTKKIEEMERVKVCGNRQSVKKDDASRPFLRGPPQPKSRDEIEKKNYDKLPCLEA